MTILDDAQRLVLGDRNTDYGHPYQDFERVATIWGAILGFPVTAEEVGLCLAGLKLARQAYHPKRDNLVDLAGYALTLQMIADLKESPRWTSKSVPPVATCSSTSEGTWSAPSVTPSTPPAAKAPSGTPRCPTCGVPDCPNHRCEGMEGL